MKSTETFTLCQPDGRKSCCACCGLFNFGDLSQQGLSFFLNRGRERSKVFRKECTDADTFDASLVRDVTSYVCPHQGFIGEGRPGCLLHPLYGTDTNRNAGFFGEEICVSFLCPAHTILSDAQKRLIISHIDDWYNYSIAMIDPDSIRWLLALLQDFYGLEPHRSVYAGRILNTFLEIHARYLAAHHGPVFFYSAPEYAIGSRCFSLIYDDPRFEREKSDIRTAIESWLSEGPPP
jgi:hypothetical protein